MAKVIEDLRNRLLPLKAKRDGRVGAGLALGILLALLVPSAATGIDLVSIELGILTLPVQFPCPVKKSSQWAVNDWDTYIVVHQRNVGEGDRVGRGDRSQRQGVPESQPVEHQCD